MPNPTPAEISAAFPDAAYITLRHDYAAVEADQTTELACLRAATKDRAALYALVNGERPQSNYFRKDGGLRAGYKSMLVRGFVQGAAASLIYPASMDTKSVHDKVQNILWGTRVRVEITVAGRELEEAEVESLHGGYDFCSDDFLAALKKSGLVSEREYAAIEENFPTEDAVQF